MTDVSALRTDSRIAATATPSPAATTPAPSVTPDRFTPTAPSASVPSEADVRRAASGTASEGGILSQIPTTMLPMGEKKFKYSIFLSSLGQKVPVPGAGGSGTVHRTDTQVSIKMDQGEFVITSSPGTPDGVTLAHDGKSYEARLEVAGNKITARVDDARSATLQTSARGFEISTQGLGNDKVIARMSFVA